MLAFSLFDRQLEYALGWMVLHSLWQGMLIALITGVVLIALRHHSAKVRYLAANFGLFAVVLAAGFTFYIYTQTSSANSADLVGASIEVPVPNQLVNTALLEQLEGLENLDAQLAEELATELAPPDQAFAPALPGEEGSLGFNWQSIQAYFNQNLPLIVGLWILGVAIFLLRMLSSISYVYYLKGRMNFPADEYWLDLLDDMIRKIGLDKTVTLVESALVRTPQVVGYLKPVILFPLGMINRLPAAEVEAILAHELSHILRHDHLLNILQSVVETLFYFHPGVWWISAQIRTERESASDEMAIQLTGDALTYAQALVTVQEMGYMPMSPALAFAGQHKSQFMLRLQRILHIKSPTTNTMEKMLTIVLIAGTLVGMGWIKNFAHNTYTHIKAGLVETQDEPYYIIETDNNAFMARNGFWNAEIKGERVYVNLQSKTEHSNWNTSRYFDKKEFSALPTTESDFNLKREAGVINFKGKFEGNEGYGKFEFVQSAEFKQYLDQQKVTGVDEDDMLHLFMANVNKDYIAYLGQNGYTSVSGSKLVEMAIHGLDKETLAGYFDTFKKAGYGQVSLSKLVELKIHGAGPKYMQGLTDLGFKNLDLDEVLEAKIHGVSADYIKDLKDAGYANLPMEKIVEFKIHGVNAEYAKRMTQANGGKVMSADELVSSKIHGLDPDRMAKIQKSANGQMSMDDMRNYSIHGVDDAYIQSLKDAGFSNLDPQEVVQAKIHGLNGAYMKDLKEAGYTDLSFDQAIEAKIHGLSSELVKAYKTAYKDLSFSKAVEFKIHGVSADYLRQFTDAGFKDISASKLVELKIHGVNPKAAQEYSALGFKDISAGDLVNLKIHGVSPEFVKNLQGMGFKSFDLDEAVNLKIHGVTPEYIQKMRDKGFKDLDLDDYVKMKIHGIANGKDEK